MDFIRRVIDQNAPHLDWVDFLFGIVLAVVIAMTVPLGQLSGSHAIAMVTAVTAFAGIYQLRHPTETVKPAVREDFNTDSGRTDFGLRNFGPGPALYLQIVVEVDGDPSVKLKPQDPPIHLPEGEFVGFQHDLRTDGVLWEDSELPNQPEGEVELYYSYVTEQGIREPASLNNSDYLDSQCLFKDLTADDIEPRSIDLEVVWEEYSGDLSGPDTPH